MRIGTGYDVHRLVSGRKLMLGGVHIPYSMGLLGHSDADVLLHAICDALLGAAALGDMGRHFPPQDDSYKDISSLLLLAEVDSKIKAAGYRVVNIDATIVAQKPHLAGYIEAMVSSIAETLTIAPGQVNVKATTTEKLGFEGQELGISSQAVVLLTKL
ncbi:MAG: 2-C-methyl-D-erythritol 2,4-cyclodiphosphate synthase [Syntrophomonadaceae bacterium]|jgi:2-C-methyl-D-erythritol 2,4-cyclodiphosphate synthase